jgi:hypothetical protein
MADPHLEVVVASGTVVTATGNQNIDGMAMGPFKTMRVQFDVTAVSGTTPSITFALEDTLDGTNWNTLTPNPAITAITTAARQVVDYTTPFTDRVRIRWTVSGTTPNFTFGARVFLDPT